MKDLGYRPNWAGRALRRQRTGLVGAVVSGPSNPWREHLVDLGQSELARHGLDLVVLPVVRRGAGLDRVMDLLDRRVVDACFTVHLEDDRSPSRLVDQPIPSIAFAESGFEGIAKVRHAYAEAAAGCASTLVGRGVRRFILVREDVDDPDEEDPIFADPVTDVLTHEAPDAETTEVFVPYRIGGELSGLPWDQVTRATREDPVVLLCKSDRLAIQIVSELARRGLDLGRSIGVVGRGDLPESAQIGLSTLGTGMSGYGEVFAALADAARTGEPVAEEWTFPWTFIERTTTADLSPLRGAQP